MKAGLAALPPEVSAAIFPLADQPFVTAEVIDAVISTYQQTLAPVVWPAFEGRRGNPVLFDRSLFAEMNQVTGDVGARPVLMAHQDQAEVVAVSEAGILRDIDRPADL
jgi:molybdenum cofactor cytidylyltransferase